MKTFPAALFNTGETELNTIVLPGMELVIPLEEDLDRDPFQDDEIRLTDLGGAYERVVKSSDPEAVPKREERLIYYHFSEVPAGIYRLSVRIGGQWVDLANGLVVTPKGAFLGKHRLGENAAKLSFESRQALPPAPPPKEPPSSPRLLPRKYMDQNPNRWDRERE